MADRGVVRHMGVITEKNFDQWRVLQAKLFIVVTSPCKHRRAGCGQTNERGHCGAGHEPNRGVAGKVQQVQ